MKMSFYLFLMRNLLNNFFPLSENKAFLILPEDLKVSWKTKNLEVVKKSHDFWGLKKCQNYNQ